MDFKGSMPLQHRRPLQKMWDAAVLYQAFLIGFLTEESLVLLLGLVLYRVFIPFCFTCNGKYTRPFDREKGVCAK